MIYTMYKTILITELMIGMGEVNLSIEQKYQWRGPSILISNINPYEKLSKN